MIRLTTLFLAGFITCCSKGQLFNSALFNKSSSLNQTSSPDQKNAPNTPNNINSTTDISDKKNDSSTDNTTDPTKTIIQTFNPTLIVKHPECMLCHAIIQGNFITEYATGSSSTTSSTPTASNTPLPVTLPTHAIYNYMSEYAAMTALFLQSTIYVPANKNITNKNLSSYFQSLSNIPDNSLFYNSSSSLSNVRSTNPIPLSTPTPDQYIIYNYLSSIKSLTRGSSYAASLSGADLKILNTSPTSVNTVKEFLTTTQSNRSDFYIKSLLNINGLNKQAIISQLTNQTTLSPSQMSANVKEIAGLSIPDFNFTLPSLSSSPPVGLIAKPNETNPQYYTSSPTQAIQCEGLFSTNLPIVIHNPTIRTKTGCRIYSSKSIFINYTPGQFSSNPPTNTTSVEGINFTADSSSIANLQLYSQVAIVMGLGLCNTSGTANISNYTIPLPNPTSMQSIDSLMTRLYETNRRWPMQDSSRWGNLYASLLNDYKTVSINAEKIYDVSVSSSVVDTTTNQLSGTVYCSSRYTDPKRNVKMSKVALFAPLVQSRLTGNISGLVIAEFLLGSLGDFVYKNDDVFSDPNVSVYPEFINNLINISNVLSTHNP